jgi:hypothetical protein
MISTGPLAFDFIEGGLELAALFEVDPQRHCGDAERQQFVERGLALFPRRGQGLRPPLRPRPDPTRVPPIPRFPPVTIDTLPLRSNIFNILADALAIA